MSTQHTPTDEWYDYILIGFGAANSLLLLQLHAQGLLDGKRIAIVDTDEKLKNDRTFCFWATPEEERTLGLDTLVSHRWQEVEITGVARENIYPMQYCHVEGITLYNKARSVASLHGVTFIREPFNGTADTHTNGCVLATESQSLGAHLVFDSRPPRYAPAAKHEAVLFQSFVGWKIKTPESVFDIQRMVMMDFNIKQQTSTQFIYLLPFSSDSALVEVTRFDPTCISEDEAAGMLETYLSAEFADYRIEAVERGVIPMSTAEINCTSYGDRWIYTGAAAGKIKPSTGYAFHAMAQDALRITQSLTKEQLTAYVRSAGRFRFYDRLLLKILEQEPHRGKSIFETLFRHAPVKNVLRFLSEKTTWLQDAQLLLHLPKLPFLRASARDCLHRAPLSMLPALLTLLFMVLSYFDLNACCWGILAAGFLLIGLPHGALDHLTDAAPKTGSSLARFVVMYLFKGALLGICWYLLPDSALLIFLLYSAWHFGEADFEEAGLNNRLQAMLWGGGVLLLLLLTHPVELLQILTQLNTVHMHTFLTNLSADVWLMSSTAVAAALVILSRQVKRSSLLLTIIYLLLCTTLPLLMAFGIYFIGQHSFNGWKHLSRGLSLNTVQLWKRAAPFTGGAVLMMLALIWLADERLTVMFFVLISCISLPHVWYMHRFYSTR